MKIFTKQEFLAVVIIVFVVGFFSFFNYKDALMKGRDNERKNDLSDIKQALEDYNAKFRTYPSDLAQLAQVAKAVPRDPSSAAGRSYLYLTDGKNFQIYASLEDKTDSEFDEKIANMNLRCGSFVCNFGRSNGQTPLDKSLEEYENELDVKKRVHVN